MTFRRVLMILMVFAGIGLSAQTFAINPYDLLGQWQMERTNLSIKYNDQIITDVWEERNDNLKCEFTKNGVYRNSEGDVGRFILKGDELTLIYPEIGEQVEYQILELDDENLAWACINVMKLTRGELQELQRTPGFNKSKLASLQKLIGKEVLVVSGGRWKRLK